MPDHARRSRRLSRNPRKDKPHPVWAILWPQIYIYIHNYIYSTYILYTIMLNSNIWYIFIFIKHIYIHTNIIYTQTHTHTRNTDRFQVLLHSRQKIMTTASGHKNEALKYRLVTHKHDPTDIQFHAVYASSICFWSGDVRGRTAEYDGENREREKWK